MTQAFHAAAAFALAIAIGAGAAKANDGYAGVSAGGIVFGKTDKIFMDEEDLFISPREIRVSYKFRNASDTDETALIAFPLPPVSPGLQVGFSPVAPGLSPITDLNYLGFTARVDGAAVKLGREIKFYAGGEDAIYATPAAGRMFGADVTARLTALGVPESFDLALIRAWFAGLPPAEQKKLVADSLFIDEELVEEGPVPAYMIGVTYYWTQIFKAKGTLSIAHDYRPIMSGSVFYVGEDLTRDYCIDEGTGRAIERIGTTMLETFEKDPVPATYEAADLKFLDYILTTAGTWAGSIGKFTLTIDKLDTRDIISLCMDGIAKTGPTTFRVEKTDFRPDKDIRLLIADVETVSTN